MEISLLSPLVSRVRTDVHWRKNKGSPPFMKKSPLTDGYLEEHLTGGRSFGVCPIQAGESTTKVAVLDLDSHKGETSWGVMCDLAAHIDAVLEKHGIDAVPFSSSGGKGMHLYFIWDEPQDAYSVRMFFKGILKKLDFEDGAGGVADSQVEIFPKQDSVPADGFGNMFILPYSGESVPLEPMADYQRMPRDYPVEWPVSAPVPVVEKPERVASSLPTGDVGRLGLALASIDPSPLDYDTWLKIGQGIHHDTEGSDEGFQLWDSWSSASEKYDGTEYGERRWESFGSYSGQEVTAGTIYKMATASGWVDAPTADDFEDITHEPDTVTPTSDPSRFIVQNALQFAGGKPPSWIVKGVVPEADLAVFYGESTSGKSFFTLDLFGAVVRGAEWRGRKVKQCRVVYLIAEGSGGFRNRVSAYASKHSLTEFPMGVIAAAPNFLEKKDIADIIAALKAYGGCDVVVVDTWAQVTPGANENSGEDMGKALSHCRKIREATGAMVVLIHHSGKDSSRGARGWSGLRAAADCEIEITANGADRTATVTKLKDGEGGIQFGFKLNVVPVGMDEDGDAVSSCTVEEAEINPSAPAEKRMKIGDNEKLLLATVCALWDQDSEWPTVDTLVNETLNRQPETTTKLASRRSNIKRALDSLLSRGLLVLENGFISLPEDE